MASANPRPGARDDVKQIAKAAPFKNARRGARTVTTRASHHGPARLVKFASLILKVRELGIHGSGNVTGRVLRGTAHVHYL